jgi:cytochrome oxidase Cu insertion factor (SCO1/SenC/PrrC family)
VFERSAVRARFGGLVIALVTWGASVAIAQVSPTFGPKDGAGLPPTDLARVAVGSPAPDFTLESKAGAAVTLSSFRGRTNAVLVFDRGHW